MKTGHKTGRRSAPRHRWQERWLPTTLNERRPQIQVFRVFPKPGKAICVEVRLTRTRREMYTAIWFDGQRVNSDDCVMGVCRDFHAPSKAYPSMKRRRKLGFNLAVARIYLNKKDLRNNGADTVAHECTHAAMAWAKWLGVDVYDDEETLAYAVGFLCQQVTNALWKRRAFDR